jgi:hypothetical protein
VKRIFRWLIHWRWGVVRVIVWIGGTVLITVDRGWLWGAAIFVFIGLPIWMLATAALVVWRRQRRRARQEAEASS